MANLLSVETAQLAEAMRLAMIALRTLVNGNAVDLADLATTDKTSLVAAINEVAAIGGGGGTEITFHPNGVASADDDGTTRYWLTSTTNPLP